LSYYPLFVDIGSRFCVVVGAGSVAYRKVSALLKAGAKVKVISPDISSELENLIKSAEIEHINRDYQEGDLDGAVLVIGATDNQQVNEAVSLEAKQKGILVNIVDQPELCTFIVPSQVSRGALKIAISTSGKSPALAKKIRKDLQVRYGIEYATFVDLLEVARRKVIAKYADEEERKKILTKLANSSAIIELIKAGKVEEAREQIEECI